MLIVMISTQVHFDFSLQIDGKLEIAAKEENIVLIFVSRYGIKVVSGQVSKAFFNSNVFIMGLLL